jgi:hypothetical protein
MVSVLGAGPGSAVHSAPARELGAEQEQAGDWEEAGN